MNFYHCIKVSARYLQRQTVRNYAFKSDLKIKWVRPEKIPSIKPEKSGDVSKLPALDPNTYIPGFQKSKELQEADPIVQSLFKIKNSPNIHTSNLHRENMIKELQRHPLDYGSMEAKCNANNLLGVYTHKFLPKSFLVFGQEGKNQRDEVPDLSYVANATQKPQKRIDKNLFHRICMLAKMTATIRRFQEHMEKFPGDRRIKINLKEMIEKRKKYLKFLRRWDYRRFEWVLEKLDLIYKPPPTEFHWITRKESLRKLTDLYCENLKQERLDAYRKKLEAQMIPFLEKKIETLEFVRKEQMELEIPITVTEEQIEATRKQLEDMKADRAEVEAAQKKMEESEIH